MRILCDENLPAALAVGLREDGHDVVDVREGMAGANDDRVLAFAVAEQRVLFTSDLRRFGNIQQTPPAATPGLVVARLGGLTRAAVVTRIREVVATTDSDAFSGTLTVIEPAQVRRRV